jgi:hypothetical protein
MKKILLLLALLPFTGGCRKKIKPKQLMEVSIGMTKQEVLKVLGEPTIIRGSMVNDFKQIIETWEYHVARGMSERETALATLFSIYTLGLGSPIFLMEGELFDPYWFFFFSDKLVKWCKAGDWETTQHNIQEIRFR